MPTKQSSMIWPRARSERIKLRTSLPPEPDSNSPWAISERIEDLRKASRRPRISLAASLGFGAALVVFAYVLVAIATGYLGPSTTTAVEKGASNPAGQHSLQAAWPGQSDPGPTGQK